MESYFKNVKRHLCRIISKSDRYRVDEFFMKHLEFLSGELKGAIGNLKEGKTKKATEKRERKKTLPKNVKEEKNIEHAVESIFTENPSLIENWRGLATKREKRKNISEKETPKVILLKNGFRAKFTGGKNLIVKNTCAFDSVSQAIAVAVVDGFCIGRIVNTSNEVYCKFIKMLISNASIQNIYQSRTEILKQFFNTENTSDDRIIISCECNVTHIFEKILIDVIYSADRIESCTNAECPVNNVKRKCAFLPLDLNIKSLSLSANSRINPENNMSICRHTGCSGIKTYEYDLKDLITFELNSEEEIYLNDIETMITLKNIEYNLASVIEFIPCESASIDRIGHYKAHCLRGTSFQCYDDMSNRVTKSRKKMLVHCIIYGRKYT